MHNEEEEKRTKYKLMWLERVDGVEEMVRDEKPFLSLSPIFNISYISPKEVKPLTRTIQSP